MHPKKRRQWHVFWEIPECPPFLTSEPARLFTRGMDAWCGKNFQDCILEYRNNTNIWYLDADEWSRLDQTLFERMTDDLALAKKINTVVERYCYPCLRFLDVFCRKPFHSMTDKQLAQAYETFMTTYVPAHASGHPANVLEIHNQRLSNYLQKYLQQRICTTDYPKSANATFTLLVTPTKDMSPQKEIKNFYRIAAEILKNATIVRRMKTNTAESLERWLTERRPTIWKRIRRHHAAWAWTVYNWEGPANTVKQYLEAWQGFVKAGTPAVAKLAELQKENAVIKRKQRAAIRTLGIDTKHQTLLSVASDIMYLKALRKDCMYKGAWASEPMYTEIGKRLGTTTHEARYIFAFEMKRAILTRSINKRMIRERTKEVVLHQRAKKSDIVLTGTKAKACIASLNVKKPDAEAREIKGQCAYPGIARGRIKYINTPDMMHKMEKGDILLAWATQPNLLSAMKKAAAFVTDFGGITCHAAIVAREWKVPCVIGTSNATKILKDGELVEVDAENGVVRRLET